MQQHNIHKYILNKTFTKNKNKKQKQIPYYSTPIFHSILYNADEIQYIPKTKDLE